LPSPPGSTPARTTTRRAERRPRCLAPASADAIDELLALFSATATGTSRPPGASSSNSSGHGRDRHDLERPAPAVVADVFVGVVMDGRAMGDQPGPREESRCRRCAIFP
jgi:hypothetical protein